MRIKDGMEKGYIQSIAWNGSTAYGSKVLRYAERWANFMEEALEHRMDVEDAAITTREIANTEWISRTMYYFAVSQLREFWFYGDEFMNALHRESEELQTNINKNRRKTT